VIEVNVYAYKYLAKRHILALYFYTMLVLSTGIISWNYFFLKPNNKQKRYLISEIAHLHQYIQNLQEKNSHIPATISSELDREIKICDIDQTVDALYVLTANHGLEINNCIIQDAFLKNGYSVTHILCNFTGPFKAYKEFFENVAAKNCFLRAGALRMEVKNAHDSIFCSCIFHYYNFFTHDTVNQNQEYIQEKIL